MSAEVESAPANPAGETAKVEVEEVEAKKDNVKDQPSSETNAAEANGRENGEKKDEARSGRKTDERWTKGRKYDNDRNGDRTHRGGFNNKRKFNRDNVKSRYDTEEKTDDPFQIRKQVEFYFSDANLMQDRFLYQQIDGSKNEAVDIKVIASFKRMQRFEPYSAVVKALKDSEKLEVINGDSTGNEQVKRKVPLPENFGTEHETVKANYEAESMKKSIYAKGFGDEEASTQMDIENFFAPYGSSAVRLRRHADGIFKGSVFVEFESEDDAKQFLELEEKPEWKGTKLSIKSKADYCKEKEDLINQGKLRRNDLDDDAGRDGYRGRGRGNFRDGRGRGRGGRGGRYNDRRDRDRDDRDRSRSPDRLKENNWRELAKKEERERKERKAEPKQEYEENGIPKVMSTAQEVVEKVAEKAEEVAEKVVEKVEEATAGASKKRPAEESAEDDGEVKKVKADAAES